ncbi:hypothetical protein Z043_110929 [Scleropages formosus]|uniref:PH domain-containing protein n=1 Tax=Scleropages formosus TaxID=113540 RepID=A0A0P7YR49_SCLFO|nr:hypothetical protein Z043_110929 [Scleropages formosus]
MQKWKKVWSIIYRESSCSVSRMEFFEFKDSGAANAEKADRTLRKQENKKVIKLRDCIRVSEVQVESCPRDCQPFLVETTEKIFLFAAENSELEGWTQALCEIAFPMNWAEAGTVKRGSILRSRPELVEAAMEDNTLYGARESGKKKHSSSAGLRRAFADAAASISGSLNHPGLPGYSSLPGNTLFCSAACQQY